MTDPTMIRMSDAQKMSTRLEGDGTVWEIAGRPVEDIIADAATPTYEARGMADRAIRYDFADGSAIVVHSDGWDIGYDADAVERHDVLRYAWPAAHGSELAAVADLEVTR